MAPFIRLDKQDMRRRFVRPKLRWTDFLAYYAKKIFEGAKLYGRGME
ncbi:unnamed protein product [Nezara viridula]|uniref:Uncharacterized protein n=1 Tax=Nezara viridula TaxID=85310 RepID=A0A9P0HNM5_NEZVI|nr:unnamed protein product [Nezara viridula]